MLSPSTNSLTSVQPSFLLSNRSHKAPKKLLSIITKDYTLTSALKSDPQTPQSSQLHKSVTPGLSNSITVSKQSEKANVNNTSLYRFPLPADLVNIQNNHSDRPTTLRIFQNRRAVTRIEDNPSPLFKKDGGSATIQRIDRRDQMESVKVLVDYGLKGYSRMKKEKDKQKGSMFVTDLWSEDYERTVIRATKLDKDLKQENKIDKRPLDLKLKELVSFYQRKSIRKMRSHENIDCLSPKTPKQGLLELKKVAVLESQEDDLSDVRNENMESAKENGSIDEILTSQRSPLPKSPLAQSTLLKAIFGESPEVKKKLKTIGPMFKNVSMTERKKAKFTFQGDTERAFEETKEKIQTEQDNEGNTTRATGKQNQSSFMSRYLFSTRSTSFKSDEKASDGGLKKKGKECDLSRKTSKDEALSVKGSPKGKAILIRKLKNNENRKIFKKQSSEILDDLIGVCKTEMDEKGECLNKLDKLKNMYEKKRMIRKNIAKVKMEEMIGDLKFMVELKRAHNAKVPNA